MPKIREIVVDSVLCKSVPQVVQRFGGNLQLVRETLRMGYPMYLGHRIRYLRQEAPEQTLHEKLGFLPMSQITPMYPPEQKRTVRYTDRMPLLSRRHVTKGLGIWR